jgi:hypothetical protein
VGYPTDTLGRPPADLTGLPAVMSSGAAGSEAHPAHHRAETSPSASGQRPHPRIIHTPGHPGECVVHIEERDVVFTGRRPSRRPVTGKVASRSSTTH